MNFSSLEFIFLFVPLFFGVYYKLPERWRNAAICIGSVIFYAAGTYKHPYFLLMLVASTVINYALGMLIDCFPRYGRHWVALGVIANIGSLFFLKYAGGSSGILLPVGLSFFAFRAVSYLVDVRKCRCPAERSPLEFAVFMCMFPCLVAGPITTYKDMRRQLCRREYSLAGFVSGARIHNRARLQSPHRQQSLGALVARWRTGLQQHILPSRMDRHHRLFAIHIL